MNSLNVVGVQGCCLCRVVIGEGNAVLLFIVVGTPREQGAWGMSRRGMRSHIQEGLEEGRNVKAHCINY